MAPKPRTLQQIRQQVAAKQKSTASVSRQSAFHSLEKKNERFQHGRPIARRDPDELPRIAPQKVKKTQPKKKKLQPRPVRKFPESAEKEVEYWRQAGGDSHAATGEGEDATIPTRIIGLARVATWELEALKMGAKSAVKKYGEVQDLVTQEVKDGVENCVDVFAVFRSELAAEVVKDGLQGKVVEGRVLQVRYA